MKIGEVTANNAREASAAINTIAYNASQK